MHDYKSVLEISAHWAAIATGAIAVIAYVRFLLLEKRKRTSLEAYLRKEKKGEKGNKGQRSLVHLTARVGLTEAELLKASVSSIHIRRVVATDSETGLANSILLEYVE